MVERSKEYVQAARVIGIPPLLIMLRHVLPNVIGPVLVVATINLAIAVITEATLSFLGIGVPATSPSLGPLVQLGRASLRERGCPYVESSGVAVSLKKKKQTPI